MGRRAMRTNHQGRRRHPPASTGRRHDRAPGVHNSFTGRRPDMTAICAFETVKATSRIDVKQSCGSRPLTLQLVGKRDPPLALNRAGLIADIVLGWCQLRAGNRNGNLNRPTTDHDSSVKP